jgi:acyl-CoA synthetase (AMP-forming)/AMP-acid ligase II
MVNCFYCDAVQAAAVAQQLQQAMAELRQEQQEEDEAGWGHSAHATPVVAVLLPRSIDYVTSVLAVVYAG